ncbi:single-stranded-DNA-specific exonuclease RecJ [Abditibacteriota bacterium]|nr:single-stranded-DNA-specific exonuclease RecJ [Abditibacteriota bacterium]
MPPAFWEARTSVDFCDRRLASTLHISPVCAAILRSRGLQTLEAVEAFFTPHPGLLRDPNSLPDIEKAVARLQRALKNSEQILVFGDYDVDGITSTALVVRTLKALGARVSYRLPERHEGYGLSVQAIEDAKAQGFDLVFTADCGITAIEQAQRAREIGIDLIISDHHECSSELPDALAVVNPKRPDSAYGFTGLSGCGVAFKVMQALLSAAMPRAVSSFEEKFVDLVALSTIADCVPLCDENRYLAYVGLQRLYETRRKGLLALINNASLPHQLATPARDGKKQRLRWSGRDVSFGLAPRLNAAGRLASPTLALRLLLSDDEQECAELAAQIEELNQIRKGRTESAMLEASESVEREFDADSDRLVVASGTGWHRGVVGLVASKLVEKYGRPAFALGVEQEHAHGSGRTCADFDLHALVEATRSLLTSGGGHAAACGLSLEARNIPSFKKAALEFAGDKLSPDDLIPRIFADCEVEARDLDLKLALQLAQMEPCGTKNEMPSLVLYGARLTMMRPMNGGHSRGKIMLDGREFDWVWWRSQERLCEFRHDQLVDCLFVPEVNEWQGRTTLQLTIKDVRPSV